MTAGDVDIEVLPLSRPTFSDGFTVISVRLRNNGVSPVACAVELRDINREQVVRGESKSIRSGETTELRMQLAGWVFEPDAHIRVHADPDDLLDESSEQNNVQEFQAGG